MGSVFVLPADSLNFCSCLIFMEDYFFNCVHTPFRIPDKVYLKLKNYVLLQRFAQFFFFFKYSECLRKISFLQFSCHPFTGMRMFFFSASYFLLCQKIPKQSVLDFDWRLQIWWDFGMGRGIPHFFQICYSHPCFNSSVLNKITEAGVSTTLLLGQSSCEKCMEGPTTHQKTSVNDEPKQRLCVG